MITIQHKPTKKIEHYPGTITLDKDYEITVIKTANGSVSYDVLVLNCADDTVSALIKATVLANIERQTVTWAPGQE